MSSDSEPKLVPREKAPPISQADKDNKESARGLDPLMKSLIVLSAVLILGGVLLSLDNWFLRPVRELAHTPGVKVWALREKGPGLYYHPRIRHQVQGITIHETVVTPELLHPARELPNLGNVDFSSCNVQPGAMALLAEFPVGLIRFSSCTIEPDAHDWIGKFPELRSAMFEDCEMDVGYFVSQCADSPTLKQVCLWDMKIQPGDFKNLKHWSHLDYLSLRRSNIDAEDIRHIAKAPLIERITLAGTDISDDEIAAIAEADVFRMIDLSQTNVTEAQISRLCQCRKLQYLHLRETDIPASVIQILEQSKHLQYVSVDHTALDTGFYEKRLSNGCVLQGSGKKLK